MQIKKTINELLFEIYLLFAIIGAILRYSIGDWEKRYDYFDFVSRGMWGSLFINLSTVILLFLLVKCFFKYIKRVPRVLGFAAAILLVYYLVWTVISFYSASFGEVFFESIATTIIIMPLLFFLGYDDKLWNIVQKRLPFVVALFLALFYATFFVFWEKYGIVETMNATYKHFFCYAITSIWLFCLIDTSSTILKIIKKLFMVLLVLAAFITRSRSWVLQSLLFLFIVSLKRGKKSKLSSFLLSILAILIVVFAISIVFPNITGELFARGLEDTRTGQYITFFSKYSFQDLIMGCGINASYTYLGEANYRYFDNQFIFTMFHYGILPVLYWCMLGISLFLKAKSKDRMVDNGQEVYAAKTCWLLVLLAYLGVSVYYQIGMDLNSVFVMILIGRAIKVKQI